MWSDMSTCGLLFHWDNIMKTERVGLFNANDNIILSKCSMSPWYSWRINHLALSNNHSLTRRTKHMDSHANFGKKVYKTTKTWWIQAILIEIRHVHYEHFGHTVQKNNCHVNSNITEPVYWHDFFYFVCTKYYFILPNYYFGFFSRNII
jgi:hypothetical protein